MKNRGAELKVYENEGIHGINMSGKVVDVEKLISAWLSAAFQL
ncbi:MAG: hypothetical protein OEM01_13025 [Desulfobulbaceae bacterium]|nr:hypothetical protein [Desulfobulbaceae bacterium]